VEARRARASWGALWRSLAPVEPTAQVLEVAAEATSAHGLTVLDAVHFASLLAVLGARHAPVEVAFCGFDRALSLAVENALHGTRSRS